METIPNWIKLFENIYVIVLLRRKPTFNALYITEVKNTEKIWKKCKLLMYWRHDNKIKQLFYG